MGKQRSLVLAPICIAAVAVAACGGVPDGSDGANGGDGNTLVVADGGGSYHDSLVKSTYEPFEDATGIEVVSTSYDSSVGAIKAQVQGAKEWDVVSLSQPMTTDEQASLFAPIDYKVVKERGLPDSSKLKYQVVYTYFATVVGFNTDVFSESGSQPSTWSDFWDLKQFPGSRALRDYPLGTLEVALLADGVAYNDLYPLDLDRAFEKLDELRSQTKIGWFSTGGEMTQFLTSGTAPLVQSWNGRVTNARSEGFPVEFTMDQALLAGQSWSVLKTATNKKAAMKFIDFVASPEVNASDAIEFPGNVPANEKAFDHLPSEIANDLPTHPKYRAEIAGPLNLKWWNENFSEVDKAWSEWYAGGD